MITNFVYTIEKHGFIPNGGRVYYLQRSQPPLLIPMVYEYFEASRNKTFVEEILYTLEKVIKFYKISLQFFFNLKMRVEIKRIVSV